MTALIGYLALFNQPVGRSIFDVSPGTMMVNHHRNRLILQKRFGSPEIAPLTACLEEDLLLSVMEFQY